MTIDTSKEAVERHLTLDDNHEAGLIPMSTQILLRALAAERDAHTARADAAEAEVARLRKVYWQLRSYATHDDKCKLNKAPSFTGPCSCGLSEAIKAGE